MSPCYSPLRAGLTAYGRGGQLIAGGELPPSVVEAAFLYSAAHDVPVCGFLGEHCVTNKMHPELEELHTRWARQAGWQAGWLVGRRCCAGGLDGTVRLVAPDSCRCCFLATNARVWVSGGGYCCRYYEPLASVVGVDEVLRGAPLRKLLFMTSADRVDAQLRPHWEAALAGSAAETMQAVPDMLGGCGGCGWYRAWCDVVAGGCIWSRICVLLMVAFWPPGWLAVQPLRVRPAILQTSLVPPPRLPPPLQRLCPAAGTSGDPCRYCWTTGGCRLAT